MFRGKTALVTGGGSGIGLHLARQLCDAGAAVVICGRRRSLIEQACDGYPGMHGVVADVADSGDLLRLEQELRAMGGALDLLINNAGVQVQDDLTDPQLGFGGIDTEIAINLVAPIKLTQRLLPLMAGRPGATIVNVVSLLAVMAKSSAPVYCASKAGLLQFSRAMQLVLAGSGIRVVAAVPPLVDTAMTRGRGQRKMSAEACAAELLRQLHAGASEIRIGQARTQLALYRVMPALAAAITRRLSAGRTLSESESAVPLGRR